MYGEAQRIQAAALAFSHEVLAKWQEKNPKVGKEAKKNNVPFLPKCVLEHLGSPKSGTSENGTVIAISGFMSHDNDKMEEWGGFM